MSVLSTVEKTGLLKPNPVGLLRFVLFELNLGFSKKVQLDGFRGFRE